MNLGEILDAIGVQLQHSPSAAAVRLARARIVNQVYLDLCGEARWAWMQQRSTLTTRPKVTWSGTVTFAFRKLTFSGSVVASWWVGHTVTITASGITFDVVIEATQGATVAWARDSTGLNAAYTTSISLTPTRYPLPDDCTDILQATSRADNRGDLNVIAGAAEGGVYDRDDFGKPHTLIVEPPAEVDFRPLDTLTATPNGSGGSWTAGTWRMFVIHRGHGRTSRRSNTVSFTTVNNDRVDLAGLGAWSAASGQRGTVRQLYIEVAGSGVFWLMNQTIAGSDGDTLQITSPSYDQETPWVEKSPTRYVRAYPILDEETASTTNTSLDIELRYQRRITPLQHELDVPMLPTEHHAVLVYRAAAQIAGQQGEAAHVKRLAALDREQTSRMRARYVTDSAKRYVRGATDAQRRLVWGVPSLGS